MTKESLMEKGLTEDQAKFVMDSLNGEFVTKTRFNEVNAELKQAKNTIAERDSQLDTLKKSSGDVDALKKQIETLQTENANQQTTHDAEIKALKLENAVDMALTAAKAKNNVAVKALLADFLEDADFAKDGTVKGLDAELKKLAEGEDTAFLFESAESKPGQQTFKGAKPGEGGDNPVGNGSMTLESFRKLSPLERHEFAVNHPEEYKNLYGGNQ